MTSNATTSNNFNSTVDSDANSINASDSLTINGVTISRDQENFMLSMACVVHALKLLQDENASPTDFVRTYLAHRIGTTTAKKVVITFKDNTADDAYVFIDGSFIKIEGKRNELVNTGEYTDHGKCTFYLQEQGFEIAAVPTP